MKNLSILFMTMLIALHTTANEVLFFYPISYEEQSDLYIKLSVPLDNAFLSLEGEKYYFKNQGVLIEDIELAQSLSFEIGQSVEGKDYILLDEAINYEMAASTNILIDAALYRELTAWSTKINQSVPLNTQLIALLNKPTIAPQEILSFTQQFYHYAVPISKTSSMENNIQAFFNKANGSDPDNPCKCNFVLNHFASVSPLKPNGGNGGNGYNYLNSGNSLSEFVPRYKAFDASSPKWHRWYTHEKGPAHDMFLRSYDSGGQFNYQWSTSGLNNTGNLAPSPSYAYNTFQFLCVGQEFNLPKDCDCTKKFCTLYEYNNYLKVIARKLKPTADVSSTAEELVVVTLHDNNGVQVVDANRNVAYTECGGSFNFEFLENLFDLAGEIVDVVIDVQDTTNGPPINDVPGAISGVGGALSELLQTPPILQTGSCEDIYLKTALLRDFECFELKANNPTTMTLQSFTFLGISGTKKWDNYAIARSDFRLQSIVLSGSEEGTDYCCSDKLGHHLYGNMGGPVDEITHNSNVTGAYYLFGPWDNFTPVGYAPVIPMNANRGYYTHNDKYTDCAPVKPKSLLTEDISQLFSVVETKLEEESTPTSPLEDENNSGIDLVENAEIQLALFPNPSHDYLNISIDQLNLGSQIELSIYNTMGQQIETIYTGTAEQNSFEMKWSNEELDSGTYYVVLRENNILIFGKAFVFQK